MPMQRASRMIGGYPVLAAAAPTAAGKPRCIAMRATRGVVTGLPVRDVMTGDGLGVVGLTNRLGAGPAEPGA